MRMRSLVEQLRELEPSASLSEDAADRIEQLEADVVKWEKFTTALCDAKNKRIEQLEAALNYVADMTYCGADAEWHFKPGYDPQEVLDALDQSSPPVRQENDDVSPGFRGNNEA
jgi:hypothetical protein